MSFFEPCKNGCLLKIKLSPNAAQNAFGAGVFIDADGEEYLKVSVTAVPEKGKANKELLKMISKKLKTAVSNLEIVSGQTDRLKKIFINSFLTAELEEKIISLKKEM